jgi:uncharacterized repeat protein (TIGR03833 family)
LKCYGTVGLDSTIRLEHSMSKRHHNNRRDGRSNGKTSNAHLIGSAVSVVQKHHQGTDVLTSGIVSEILTNSDFHPRGIKVRLIDGTVGRIAIASTTQQTRTQNNNYDYSTTTEDAEQEDGPRRQASLADFMVNVERQAPLLPMRQEEIQMNVSPSSHSAEKEWACSACTFVNSGLLPECELCQTTRP